MIDTMFFLLVFFMVATLSMTMERGMPVNLPRAASAKEELQHATTLTLTKEGSLFFDKEPIAGPDEAVSRLATRQAPGAEVAVVINADRSVEHGRVVELMDALRRGGIVKMAIAVKSQHDHARTERR
jgi:biopolymer transport protein ExbD